ncbi:cell proliferation protein CDC123 NDAI_0A02840 [Naumovozyma dairenensis CBS 421]|uniref:Uncharacterized protein n=1 Tax=Naumovozyma dairenensis (strain ATCC 10597 / BCRC 20456 / CBS 421 / NBRC 0211 / NRRL Y-12639) TaxID=1071378 RepID=G0W3Q3_NAUDC|nr:hypothetical protein NDAI_0A02840 [Naumovozyma dairenensis CBS 421]CCD22441.1 hypothetical protein NDAI_0A02840 [Naumovozyma dairenensis CBS 421]
MCKSCVLNFHYHNSKYQKTQNNIESKSKMASQDYTPLTNISVTKSQISNCSFSKWYPLFKSHIPKAMIIKPLPNEFIQYLEQDGIILPNEDSSTSFYTQGITNDDENEYSDWEEQAANDESSSEQEQENERVDPLVHFPEFHNKLKSAIDELGSVTPKLNWSAPRDATWILPNNTMKCNEVNELYLLLNASNYIMHDLQNAFDECTGKEEEEEEERRKSNTPEFELILRKWFDINPALEFRVFVQNGKIIGISQRDLNYYDYLDALSDQFKDMLDGFVKDVIVPKFPDKDFVVDVYIPRPFNKIFLIDINPFARKTDPLLFSWNELIESSGDKKDYELRLVKENNVGRFVSKEHSENQVPKDLIDAALDPQAIKELTEKWKELLSRQEKDEENKL